MIIPIKIDNGIQLSDNCIEDLTFKSLNINEAEIEEFLRKNIGEIFEDETLLIIGKQVQNKENGRSDLTAIDGNGSLVLIEIKRDVEDIKQRKVMFEFQAIRYAASYAKIKSVEQLAETIYAPYIEKHKSEFQIGRYTVYEKALIDLNQFLNKTKSETTFNAKQRIFLVASSFDSQTLSAVAWLIANGIDINCFQIIPKKLDNNMILEVDRILPVPNAEDFYVEIKDKSGSIKNPNEESKNRRMLPKMDMLLQWGIIQPGQALFIKGFENDIATIKDSKFVEFNGNQMTLNEWGKKVTRWSTINIYEWAIVKENNKSLYLLIMEKIYIPENEKDE